MSSFIEYLNNIGIITRDFKCSQNIIFTLSDYFKNLTPSDAYDLAVRIYDKYHHKPVNHDKATHNLIKLCNSNKLWAFKSLKSHYPQPRNPKRSNSQESIKLQGLNETCERLYMDGMVSKVKKEQYTQDKLCHELKDCTFKPQVSNESIQTGTQVFDRLYQSNLVGKFDLSGLKEQLELKNCTFTPQITSNGNIQPSDGIFDRLYKESELRNQSKNANHTPIREQRDLEQCTFKPSITSNSIQRKGSRVEFFDRLHQESAEKQQVNAFRKIEQEQEQVRQCPFKPTINPQIGTPTSIPAHERLYQISTNKKKQPEQPLHRIVTSSDRDGDSLFERMKLFVNQKKRKIEKLSHELNVDLTFKPKINPTRSYVASQQGNSISRTMSQMSTKSDRKAVNSKNTMSSFIFNSRKSQRESEKENSLSVYCETAYFQGEQKQKQAYKQII